MKWKEVMSTIVLYARVILFVIYHSKSQSEGVVFYSKRKLYTLSILETLR